MRRQRLAITLIALVVGGITLATPRPSAAIQSDTFTTTVEVGAGRTLPSGTWAYNDVCQVGYNGTAESRCSVEFNVAGILSTALITDAQIRFSKTGGCGTQDCPIDIAFFGGNGSANLPGDVTDGTFFKTVTPGFAAVQEKIEAQLQARVSSGDDYFGVRLSRSSSSTHNPDVQSFDYGSFKLAVTYIQRPVDITVHLAGLGEGKVESNIGGQLSIDCPGACKGTFEWLEPLTLTATPASLAFFSHWEGGACDGSTDPVCSFDVPATDPDITAFFDPPIGPPISQPPGATPAPSPTQPTPPPLPTARASGGGGPLITLPPAPTNVIASDGTIITPPPPPPTQVAVNVASGAAPTIVGLGGPDAGEAGASSGIGLPIVILLILVLGGVVGGGVYWFTKRRQDAALPPPQP